MHYDVLIVGAGITGAVHAERLAADGKKVLVVDRREHIAGNCYDYLEDGIHVHKYGPHIFHTSIERVWSYLSRFTDWHVYMHTVLASIDGTLAPLPFNFNTLYMLFPPRMAARFEEKLTEKYEYNSKVPIAELLKAPDEDLKFLANYVYQKVFVNYTMKQWGMSLDKLDSSVGARVPILVGRDDRYFTDKYQGIPKNGYTALIKNILANDNIAVKTGVDFTALPSDVTYDKLIYTGCIDEYYKFKFGNLPYRSVKFFLERHSTPSYQPVAVVNYPNNYDFTRITEFRHFLSQSSDCTYLMREYPEEHVAGKNDPIYPILTPENDALYKQYQEQAEADGITFTGRLGAYKYFDIDKAVDNVLAVYE